MRPDARDGLRGGAATSPGRVRATAVISPEGSRGQTAGMDETDVREAHRAAAVGEALLLDVREDDEWAHGRAPGAVHVPMGELRTDSVDRDRPVLVVCRVGGRSAAVAEALEQIGYDVRNVTGGMLAWQAAGLPVERDGGGPGTRPLTSPGNGSGAVACAAVPRPGAGPPAAARARPTP